MFNKTEKKPLVYIILGATGSGRREMLADCLDATADGASSTLVLMAEHEAVSPHDVKLGRIERWRWMDGQIMPLSPEVRGAATRVFWLADGKGNPVDQIEALKGWIKESGLELARIFTVVNCKLGATHPAMLLWYDACIHFSDVALLGHRLGVENKWVSDFRSRYEDKHMPCLIEMLKQGRVKNPPLVLEPEARRMSLYFDESPWDDLLDSDVEIGFEDDDEPADKEELDEEDEDGEGPPPMDSYFELRAGGRRVIELPDVQKYLDLISS